MIKRGSAQDHVVVWQAPCDDLRTDAPGLIRLPSGRLLIPFVQIDIRGRRASYAHGRELGTEFYRSDNHGASWQHIGRTELDDGTPFVHGGRLYYLCNYPSRHDIIIIASDDDGTTWTEPVTLFEGRFWNTAAGFAIRDDMLYCAFGESNDNSLFNKRGSKLVALACDLTRDPLDPTAWRRSNSLVYPGTPRGLVRGVFRNYEAPRSEEYDHWLEPNVVEVDGNIRVVARNRIDVYATSHIAAICDIRDNGDAELALEFCQFHPMPGAQNNFHIKQDPVTGYYWTPVNLPTRSQDLAWHRELEPTGYHGPPGNERRIMALIYSADCLNWFQACIVAMWPNARQGFQYSSPLIDGDDMLFAIRSSRDRTSQHDNDLVTFHRLPSFRDYAIDLTKRNDPA